MRIRTRDKPDKGDDDATKLVHDRWLATRRELAEARRNHHLNESFYHGQQHVRYNARTNNVEQLAPEIDRWGRERPRITDNILKPRIESLRGRLIDRSLMFEPKVSSADVSVLQGGQLAKRVITATHDQQQWEDLREGEVLAAILGGTSAVMIERDRHAEHGGVEDRTGKVHVSDDVHLTKLSITEFGLEPGSATWLMARWFIACTAVPPEQVKAHYRLDWLPDCDAKSTMTARHRALVAGAGDDIKGRVDNLTAVYTMYERPNPLCEKGRWLVTAGGKIVVDEAWPFPFTDTLNLYPFRQSRIDGVWYGTTVMNDAVPLQAEYNKLKSNIAEHSDKAGNARMMVPFGSLESLDDLGDEAGELVPYHAAAGQPGYMAPPQLARWIPGEIDRLERSVDEILHAHAVSRGAVNLDRQSGLALSIVAEKNDTPLGEMARDQAAGWEHIAHMVAEVYANSSQERETSIEVEGGIPVTLKWRGERMRGQTRFRVPLETVQPTSRAGTAAMITTLKQSFPEAFQNVDMGKLGKLLQLPEVDLLGQALDADVVLAQKENHLMAVGEAMVPEKWHDHAKHMAEHNAYRNTIDFMMASDDVRRDFELHLQAHQHMIQEEAEVTAALNDVQAGLGALPQANNPLGMLQPPAAVQAPPEGMN